MESSITAFASYRMPGEKDFTSVASNHEVRIADAIDLTASNRFYVTSFDKKVIFYFTPDETKTNEFFKTDFELSRAPKAIKKSGYTHQVDNIKRKIKAQEFEKVVLSRVKLADKTEDFDPYELFSALCEKYPNAFVYLFYSELSGLWIGATPELLISKQKDTYETVSLAGTKLIDEAWTAKEEEEQQFVTDFITEIINGKCKKVAVNHREDHVIGAIKHLKTLIEFEPYLPLEINDIISKLQPTPAVCGIPKADAMEYIKKMESHSRSFYTGALGPIGIANQTSLFVNLRCMQVCKDALALYVGGGITTDSDAKSEWLETERKANVLLDVIEGLELV